MIEAKITAIITCYNEEDIIEQAIRSILWADEIIVVDSFSNDNTVKIIKGFKYVKLLQHTYETPTKQKNWVISQAKYPWIFLIDADEVPTSELVEEIQSTIKHPEAKELYWIYRQNYFMRKKLNFIWQGDKVIRLFQRDECKYQDVYVHEEIEHVGRDVGYLKNKMNHYSYKNMDHYLDKIRRYADWQAKDYLDRTQKVTFFHLWLKPSFRFFKHYIIQGGILDGRVGYILSKTMAWGVYLRYVKIKEIRDK